MTARRFGSAPADPVLRWDTQGGAIAHRRPTRLIAGCASDFRMTMSPTLRRWIDWLVLAAVLCWAVALAVDSRRETARRNLIGGSILILASPILKASHALRQRVERYSAGQFEASRLLDENERLRRDMARLRLELATALDTNARLTRLAGGVEAQALSERYRQILAEIVGRGRDALDSGFLISRGARDGLAPGMPVVYGDALVGTIRETQPATAYVQTLTDPNSLVACVLQGSREAGITRGLGGASVYLEFLPDLQTAALAPQAALVTSGLTGSLFPGGLRVGVIARIEANDFGELVGLVEPAASFSRLEEVIVLAPQVEPTTPPLSMARSAAPPAALPTTETARQDAR